MLCSVFNSQPRGLDQHFHQRLLEMMESNKELAANLDGIGEDI